MRGGRQLPLLGRGAELASAIAVLDRVAAATGQALFIEGEAGIGKTRLLEELLHESRDRGFQVVRGTGRQLETELPFAPLVGALGLQPENADGRRAAVGRLLVEEPSDRAGGLGPADDGTQRQMQVVQACVDLIDDRCEGGPLVLALEDAHWIDAASLAVVDRLTARLAHLPLVIVLTARRYPRTAELDGVLDRLLTAGAAHVSLSGLTEAALSELAGRVLGTQRGPGVLAQLATVAGNPLFATELLTALEDDGAVRVNEGVADLRAPQQLPTSLRSTVLRRLTVLPDDTVELLRVAALLGVMFEPAALAAVTDRAELDVVRGLEPAIQAGLVSGAERGLAFHHSLVQEAIYEELPRPVRDTLHAAAAAALADAGYPPEATAPHLLRGALPSDPSTIGHLRRVASRLGARAPDLATQLLERALGLVFADDPQRAELRLELATALGWAHRPEEAADLADELLTELEPGRQRRAALTIRAMQAQFLGGFERFGEQLKAAAAEAHADPNERARLLALATVAQVYSDDPARAMTVGTQALEAAEEAGDQLAVCGTLLSQAVATHQAVDDAAAIALARRAVEVARRSDDPELRRVVAPELTLAHILGDRPEHRDEAIIMARKGLAAAEEHGLPGFAARAHLGLGVLLHRAGRWDDAAVELEAAFERGLELGHGSANFLDVFFRLARIEVHRGDLPAAGNWLARAEAALGEEPVPHGYAAQGAIARATFLDAMGDSDGARDVLADAYTGAPSAVRPAVTMTMGVPLVRLVVATGQGRDLAEELLADLPTAEEPMIPWLRAILDGDAGRMREALARARESGTWIHQELPLLLEDAADVLSQTDDGDDEPADLLAEALEIWEDMGATREVARLEARLRDLGVRRGKRGPRGRPATGWEALTETEQRVVDLVAEGLIYRDVGERMFISRRTVETHVAHIFTKLGVSSRRELEAAYAQQQADLTTAG